MSVDLNLVRFYGVLDKKTGRHVSFFSAHNDDDAKRICFNSFLNQNCLLSQFPGDYDVRYLLTYNLQDSVVVDNLGRVAFEVKDVIDNLFPKNPEKEAVRL